MINGIPCPVEDSALYGAHIIDELLVRGTITESGHVPIMGEYLHISFVWDH
jgi:hypothetical protein